MKWNEKLTIFRLRSPNQMDTQSGQNETLTQLRAFHFCLRVSSSNEIKTQILQFITDSNTTVVMLMTNYNKKTNSRHQHIQFTSNLVTDVWDMLCCSHIWEVGDRFYIEKVTNISVTKNFVTIMNLVKYKLGYVIYSIWYTPGVTDFDSRKNLF